METTIIIRTPELVARAVSIIERVSLDPVHEVVVRPHKRNRSVAQNAILWKWLTVIGAELGETKEAVHERYKERFLVPIYERDDREYAEMIDAVRAVHRRGMTKEAQAMKRQIIALTSTTKANVQQFTEYLNDIEADARSIGITLPHPEDIYYEAMGRRHVP